MAAVDAQLFWLSAKVPNDQFLLYAFDGSPDDLEAAIAEVRRRAVSCPELSLRAVDDSRWRFPRWAPGTITDEQFRVQDGAGQSWQACSEAVSRLPQLDSTRAPWRVHVFPWVAGIPGSESGPRVAGSVVVVQISHALGDGTRSAVLAASLLGRRRPPPLMGPPDRGVLLWRAAVAAREHRRLMREIDAGSADPPGTPRPTLSVNTGPRRAAVVRTLVFDRTRLPGRTVTVGALVAIADALGGYLTDRGEDVGRLGAEVPISDGGDRQVHNNFRNVGVDLHPELSRDGRTGRIAAQLAAHRRRGEHPALRASAAAFASVPAPVLRWGVGHFDPEARPHAVSGHTVVSSVNRGPADLAFGGHRVLFTAGYPALSPVMGLTHGVHGIGDTVAISVHADPAAVDIEDYLDRLANALP
jgi:hypothetical protein